MRSLSACSDRELIARIDAGDKPALGELYDRYGGRAYRVAMSVCRDPGRAEDAVQNAFVSIWRSHASYQHWRGTVAAWLLSTVHHRAIDMVRAESKHLKLSGLPDEVPDPDAVPAQVIAMTDRERIRVLLAGLPAAQREVIVLAFYGGLSHTQIAEHLEIPTGTVKGRMRLGLSKLRAGISVEDRTVLADPDRRAEKRPGSRRQARGSVPSTRAARDRSPRFQRDAR